MANDKEQTSFMEFIWMYSYECLQFPITTTYLVFDWWHFASERCKLAANSFMNGGPVSKNRFYLSIKRKINWYQSIEMRFSSITTLHNAISDALECFKQFETCVNRFIYTESKHRIVRWTVCSQFCDSMALLFIAFVQNALRNRDSKPQPQTQSQL